jgi:hypothetical protein
MEIEGILYFNSRIKNENFGHLIIVNDGQVSSNDIKGCDKLVE